MTWRAESREVALRSARDRAVLRRTPMLRVEGPAKGAGEAAVQNSSRWFGKTGGGHVSRPGQGRSDRRVARPGNRRPRGPIGGLLGFFRDAMPRKVQNQPSFRQTRSAKPASMARNPRERGIGIEKEPRVAMLVSEDLRDTPTSRNGIAQGAMPCPWHQCQPNTASPYPVGGE